MDAIIDDTFTLDLDAIRAKFDAFVREHAMEKAPIDTTALADKYAAYQASEREPTATIEVRVTDIPEVKRLIDEARRTLTLEEAKRVLAEHEEATKTRIYAKTNAAEKIADVTLDGVSIHARCNWVDPVRGEAGCYPVLPGAEGEPVRLDKDAIQRRDAAGLPVLDTIAGRIEVTYRD